LTESPWCVWFSFSFCLIVFTFNLSVLQKPSPVVHLQNIGKIKGKTGQEGGLCLEWHPACMACSTVNIYIFFHLTSAKSICLIMRSKITKACDAGICIICGWCYVGTFSQPKDWFWYALSMHIHWKKRLRTCNMRIYLWLVHDFVWPEVACDAVVISLLLILFWSKYWSLSSYLHVINPFGYLFTIWILMFGHIWIWLGADSLFYPHCFVVEDSFTILEWNAW